MELVSIGKNIQSPHQYHASSFQSSHSDSITKEDEELELQWAAIERLPAFKQLRTSLFDSEHSNGSRTGSEGKRVIDVTKLGALERHVFIEKIIKHIEKDNLLLLQKLRERIERVDVKLPTVEVRYRNVFVEAECEVVQGKPLPTLWNSIASVLSVYTKAIHCKSQKAKISVLKGVSGIIKPSRLTLLLGPPSCGKTTLLLALAGQLNQSHKVKGEISYNGYRLDEFAPQKTSAYISQYDLHIPEMTVRETIDFSARCQGVGSKAEIMMEVIKREKEAGIVPDSDIDTYMKATAIAGQQRTLQTDYILQILGLDSCADVVVGDAMKRGISGGQKKRLTTGEMIVGPTKVLLMDEISTGLDSSTTFQIVTYLQQLVHITDATALVALLQPTPETFELFDDIILMAEGKILYHGPRSHTLQYFEGCGFKCPERKGAADFLQEVISEKDQAQFWCRTDLHYSYISVDQFCEMFKTSSLGQRLEEELSNPYDRSNSPKNSLSFSIYPLNKCELFKACMARELLLMKRNSFVYVFKTTQLVVTAFMTMTVFIRTRMAVDLVHADYFMGSLFYALVRLMTNGVAELSLTVTRLPVFHKHQSFFLYPAWAYCIPASILKIPYSLLESILWTSITYYVIGYSPEVERLFRQFLLLFSLHLASTSLCRFVASVFQTMVAATTLGSLTLLLMFLFGGFLLPRLSLPPWLRWGFWISPMTYGEIGLSLNEFLAPRWQKATGNMTIGQSVLASHGLNFDGYFYWISVGALIGFMILFDLGFILALTYLKPPGMSQTLISKEKLSQLRGKEDHKNRELGECALAQAASSKTIAQQPKSGHVVLPFEPVTMTFQEVQYFVDTPPEMRERGFKQKKLQLLQDMTGVFRPGILTALMGVSGAGKTTLMDVLCGRKTGGTIEGDIRIGGYPKVQKLFARISGYCEQNDIHSPQITVEESVIYSAWLRLPAQINPETKAKFVAQVIEVIELDGIKDSLVGIPGQSGLSTEQRKRLTIAVELVSNPSIIFMDEPTSGLDARAAAIVIRTVKNIVATGRTTVCTIHQPSIDIFEAFDELILMKRGGQIIYSGILGHHSSKLIEYFEGIRGLPKIKNNYNPATWMLEVTSASVEAELGLDFATIYRESPQYQNTVELVRQVSKPPPASKSLHFPTRFPQNSWEQFLACLWKQHLSYWRSPEYNLVRFTYMIVASVLFGAVFWQKGQNINNEQDLMSILGSMFIAVIFLGINNCSTLLPYVATERTVLYREKFAGMYSSWAYSFAQVAIEVPYTLFQAILFVALTYPSIGYYWSAYKVFWYFYATFCTFLYFVYLGMLIVSLSSNVQVASILATAVYTILNLFAGFLMPGPKIPKWWVWCYWICPTSWSLNGLLTSQYGDENKKILIFGEPKTISSFIEEFYGFRHDHLGLVAFVLLAFPIVYASLFAYCITKLNFQRR
ncbi:pleiotropic drug resistance protein 3-like [Rhododendron vialii]|uniref:pleiotropic drug resistance protein 3-like n=1 Tax=Rhododendron vialii TaxID=182163 RepID=UPI00265DF7AF|nr:pleiotropic drug resistance protein 3-like [Rhododendron vialii]